jgi:hypothetical protein
LGVRVLGFAVATRLGFLAVVLAALCGCAGRPSGLPRAVQQQRAAMRTPSYRVLDAGLGAGENAYTFLNARFRFEFSRDFGHVPGYETAEARFERGRAASEVLNGGYAFVREIFGIEAHRPIRVVIVPDLDGDPSDARTEIRWRTIQDRIVADSAHVTMYLGRAAFESPPALAHELTHALVGVYALPSWLDEGIATLVEMDYAHGATAAAAHARLVPLGLDADGYNVLETWRGDDSPLPFRSPETYGAAYAIVSEIRRRYGADVFARLFRHFERTQPGRLGSRRETADIIAGLNRVTNQDTRPFFEELRFRTDYR